MPRDSRSCDHCRFAAWRQSRLRRNLSATTGTATARGILLLSAAVFCLATVVTAEPVPPSPPVTVHRDAYGRLQALEFDGDLMPVRDDLRWFQTDWTRSIGLTQTWAGSRQQRQLPRGRKTTGIVDNTAGQRVRYTLQTLDRPDGFDLSLGVQALTELSGEGIYYWLEFPAETFRQGVIKVFSGDPDPDSIIDLPADLDPDTHVVGSRTCERVRIEDESAERFIDLRFLEPHHVQIQDLRRWGTPAFGLLITLRYGERPADDRAFLAMTLEAGGKADHTPASASIAETPTAYPFAGMGGNYCFQIESPQVDYTLKHLNVKWARTEMTLQQWEPENDNDDPENPDWTRLRATDREDSELRREFELARRLQNLNIPYSISIWHLPAWCYEDPSRSVYDNRRRVAPGMWPEVAESIVTYLQHAKRAHGVEPDLFSFNEPDIGVRVLMTPEEHRQAVVELSRRFAKAGLKTRFLLGDVSNARGTQAYLDPIGTDSPAAKAAGAIGFHSWGGGSDAEFAAWRQTAEGFGLPLLITEFGTDPFAWKTGGHTDWFYALNELKLLCQMMTQARPRSILTWEYTADYALLTEPEPGTGNLIPTPRYHFLSHFSNLLPADARYLAATSDHAAVRVVALTSASGPNHGLVIHVANLGASRTLTLTGLPPTMDLLRRTQTTRDAPLADCPALPVTEGTTEIELPAQSLTTLHQLPQAR